MYNSFFVHIYIYKLFCLETNTKYSFHTDNRWPSCTITTATFKNNLWKRLNVFDDTGDVIYFFSKYIKSSFCCVLHEDVGVSTECPLATSLRFRGSSINPLVSSKLVEVNSLWKKKKKKNIREKHLG